MKCGSTFSCWIDGSKNVVSASELKTVNCKEIRVGCKVKMLYGKRWYYGKAVAIEYLDRVASEENVNNFCSNHPIDKSTFEYQNDVTDSDEDVPLAKLKQFYNLGPASNNNSDEDVSFSKQKQLDNLGNESNNKDINDNLYMQQNSANDLLEPNDTYLSIDNDDSDADPTVCCEVRYCKKEVFSACPYCDILLCFQHFNEDLRNCNHGRNIHMEIIEEPEDCVTNTVTAVQPVIHPESFIMDGEEREATTIKTPKINKQKLAKSLRNIVGKRHRSRQ